MTEPVCAEHRCHPSRECVGVQLTRSLRPAPMCLCGHPKAVHQQWWASLDCNLCDCLHYEGARSRRRLTRIEPGRQFGILVTFGCLCWVAFLAWLFLGHVRP